MHLLVIPMWLRDCMGVRSVKRIYALCKDKNWRQHLIRSDLEWKKIALNAIGRLVERGALHCFGRVDGWEQDIFKLQNFAQLFKSAEEKWNIRMQWKSEINICYNIWNMWPREGFVRSLLTSQDHALQERYFHNHIWECINLILAKRAGLILV